MPDDYDPSALDESAESVDVPDGLSGEITDTTKDVAHNIFGEDTVSEPDKAMLVVTVEVDMGEEIQEVEEVFSLPESDKSWLNPKFKLARFREKYGGAPDVGMDVTVSYDDDGFLEINMPERAMINPD